MRFFKKKQIEERQSRARPQTEPAKTPVAFSYHAKRSARPESPSQGRAVPSFELDNSRKGSKGRRYAVFSVLIILALLVILALRVSTAAKVDIIEPAGFDYMPRSLNQYIHASANAIGSSIYNQNKLTISSDDVAMYLEKRYPEIAYAAVTVPLIGNKPTIHIQLASPSLIYSTSTNSYVLDGNGNIIGSASILNAKEIGLLPIVESSYSGTLNDGVQVLTNQNVQFIRIVKIALSAKAISVAKMVLVPQAEELDVYPAGQPYFVKFNLYQTDALQQVGTYLATIATLKSQNQTPKQYIDVRVDGRAYYK